jgi:TatA/E family protein of Tat protein translocase
MGPVGAQEMVIIFIVALVLFGPKKLPELGRTIGKALTQFRRVSADLKSSFEREMQNLERETEAEKLRELGQSTAKQIQSHAAETLEYPYYDSAYESEPDNYSYTAAINPPVSASEVPGAESTGTPEVVTHEAVTHEAVTNGDVTHDTVTAQKTEAPTPAVEGTVPRETPQHTN